MSERTVPCILSRRRIHTGWNRLDIVTLATGAGDTGAGGELVREVIDHGDGAAVLAFDPRRRLALLVRQLRPGKLVAEGGEGSMLEVPAGLVDPGESPAAAAVREVAEETGVRLGPLVAVAAPYPAGGTLTERTSLFLAEADLDAAAAGETAGGGLADEGEAIEVVTVTLAELARRADDGALDDMKTFALVQTLRLRRPELFA